jgi:hypothetical protein
VLHEVSGIARRLHMYVIRSCAVRTKSLRCTKMPESAAAIVHSASQCVADNITRAQYSTGLPSRARMLSGSQLDTGGASIFRSNRLSCISISMHISCNPEPDHHATAPRGPDGWTKRRSVKSGRRSTDTALCRGVAVSATCISIIARQTRRSNGEYQLKESKIHSRRQCHCGLANRIEPSRYFPMTRTTVMSMQSASAPDAMRTAVPTSSRADRSASRA